MFVPFASFNPQTPDLGHANSGMPALPPLNATVCFLILFSDHVVCLAATLTAGEPITVGDLGKKAARAAADRLVRHKNPFQG
jgi:hypothetical protein